MNKIMLEYNSFHGDFYLINLVIELAKLTDFFIETGTFAGNTLKGFSSTFPEIKCHSCEIDNKRYNDTVKNVAGIKNANVHLDASPDFLYKFLKNKYKEKILFWLDAHGYGYKWPLKDEIDFITKNCESFYLLIDDFKVPGIKEFGYDKYKGQECSYDYIKKSINGKVEIYFPVYKEKTSKQHPLQGWVLFVRNLKVPQVDYIRQFK